MIQNKCIMQGSHSSFVVKSGKKGPFVLKKGTKKGPHILRNRDLKVLTSTNPKMK